MWKFILTGAIIGSLIGQFTDVPVEKSLVVGAFLAICFYLLITKRNIHDPITETNDTSVQSIQLREEQLEIHKKRVQTGEVKIHKEVVEEKKTFTIPVRRLEMVIEAGDEEELRIPLKQEEIEFYKHPVQVNEVKISKRQKVEMKQIKEKVKKETLHVGITGEADLVKNLPPEKNE